jgi:hypothetical protein
MLAGSAEGDTVCDPFAGAGTNGLGHNWTICGENGSARRSAAETSPITRTVCGRCSGSLSRGHDREPLPRLLVEAPSSPTPEVFHGK